ncbi:MAG: hypothetical protein V3U96_12075 [Paracoccaceae bacterium]
MTLIKPDGNDGTARDILEAAAEQFQRAIKAFQNITNRIEAGEENPSPETEKLVRQFGALTTVLFKEKQRIEDSIRKDAGIIHDYAIDFDGARKEIQCRMACLRRAADPGDISE